MTLLWVAVTLCTIWLLALPLALVCGRSFAAGWETTAAADRVSDPTVSGRRESAQAR